MGAKGIILPYTTPCGIDQRLTGRLGTDAVLPVIGVCKTTARPPKDGNIQLFESIDNIGAHSILVGNLGIFAYIQAAVNAAPQMLGKMPVDVFIDGADRAVAVNENQH